VNESTIRHGYTLTELHRLAHIAARTPAASWLDARDAYDAAWHSLVEALLLTDKPPESGHLVVTARQAVFQTVRDERHHRGIPRAEPWAGQGAAPNFAKLWAGLVAHTPDHAPDIIDRQALADIWPALREVDRDALLALAATGDYRAAADLLGLRYSTLTVRLSNARRRFLRLWHQGETPSTVRGTDRRVGSYHHQEAA
jgi:hypothetical protein